MEPFTRYFDLSIPYIYSDMKFLTPAPKQIRNLWSIFAPFTYHVWIALIVVITIIPIILSSCSNMEQKLFPFYSSTPYSHCSYSFLYSISIFIGIGLPRFVPSAVRHIIIWTFMTSTLIITAYNCNLVSFLTFPVYEQPIDTLEEFVSSGLYWGDISLTWERVFGVQQAH